MLENLLNGQFGNSAVIWHFFWYQEWLSKVIRN